MCKIAALMLGLMLVGPAGADASTLGPSLATHGDKAATVILGGDRNYPPFQMLGEDTRATGFDVELFRAIAEQADLATRVELGNWGIQRNALRTGKIDVIAMFATPARRDLYLFSTPFLHRYHLVFGHRGSAYIDSIKELSGRQVAVQYAGLAWEALRQAGNVSIVPTAVESAAIDMVAGNQAEYALVPMNIGYNVLLHHPDQKIVALSPPLLEFPYAFAVTPGRPALVEQINRGLAQVQANGTFDNLYLQWLANLRPPQSSFRSGLAWGSLLAVPFLLLVIAALWWLRRSRRHAASQQVRADSEAKRRRELEHKAEYLAYNDDETGLRNRHGLLRMLTGKLDRTKRHKQNCALIRIDLLGLDTLKAVAGDAMERRLLRAIARRLDSARAAWSACCVGRGQFALVIQAVDDLEAARRTVASAIETVQGRVDLDGLPIEQHCCAGLAMFPDHADSAQQLLRAASMACSVARKRGSGCVTYTSALEPDARNLTLLGDLRDAIHSGALAFAVQPKIELETGRMVGAEMLARWHHPQHGELAPDSFIPIAESTGAIGQLTGYMMHQAVRHKTIWRQFATPFHLAINASVNDFGDSDLVESIMASARSVQILIVLEVTESDLLRDGEAVLNALARLRQSGIGVSLDDFGTGYSSLTYLKRMAPDEIKIDRSFVRGVLDSTTDQAIVRAVIELAHSLGAKVCAEGVEDPAILKWLQTAGCDLAQGFAIARPMSLEELQRWEFSTV